MPNGQSRTNDQILCDTTLFMPLWTRATQRLRDQIITLIEESFYQEGRSHLSSYLSLDAHAESFMFAMALNQVRMAAILAQDLVSTASREALRLAIEDFDQVAPDVKKLRDTFAHFDDYISGEGRLHRGADSPSMNISRELGVEHDGKTGQTRINRCIMGVIISPALPKLQIEIIGATDAGLHLAKTALEAIRSSLASHWEQ